MAIKGEIKGHLKFIQGGSMHREVTAQFKFFKVTLQITSEKLSQMTSPETLGSLAEPKIEHVSLVCLSAPTPFTFFLDIFVQVLALE